MRREDQLDFQTQERFSRVLRRKIQLTKAADRLSNRFVRRLWSMLQLAASQHANSVAVLGHICKVEKNGESADYGFQVGIAKLRDTLLQSWTGRDIPIPACARQFPNLFHQRQLLGSCQRCDYLAQHLPKHTHVAAEQLVVYGRNTGPLLRL